MVKSKGTEAKTKMKYKFVFILLLLSTIDCFSQVVKYQVSDGFTISAVVRDKQLSFTIDIDGLKSSYNYGFFEFDTTLLSQSRFIYFEKSSSKPLFKEFLVVSDSIVLLNIADWNDRYYIFPFVKKSKSVVPLLQNEDKVKELFVTKLPYIYYNNKSKILIDLFKEIQEFNYGDVTKNYFQVIIYNMGNLTENTDRNILRLDSSSWPFYSELFSSDSKEFFANVYKKIFLYLKLCGN